ncbi:hypothetical protein GCM10009104_01660 [Marinobacterium maritimum]|uniref:Uncharacterized protein n=1 Tax=Marinobacterium maritimum TaxID=500162 RepID=A0ABP3T5F7_9GAMM
MASMLPLSLTDSKRRLWSGNGTEQALKSWNGQYCPPGLRREPGHRDSGPGALSYCLDALCHQPLNHGIGPLLGGTLQ